MIEVATAFLKGFLAVLGIAFFAKLSAANVARSLKGALQFIAIIFSLVVAISLINLYRDSSQQGEIIAEIKEMLFGAVGMLVGYVFAIRVFVRESN